MPSENGGNCYYFASHKLVWLIPSELQSEFTETAAPQTSYFFYYQRQRYSASCVWLPCVFTGSVDANDENLRIAMKFVDGCPRGSSLGRVTSHSSVMDRLSARCESPNGQTSERRATEYCISSPSLRDSNKHWRCSYGKMAYVSKYAIEYCAEMIFIAARINPFSQQLCDEWFQLIRLYVL